MLGQGSELYFTAATKTGSGVEGVFGFRSVRVLGLAHLGLRAVGIMGMDFEGEEVVFNHPSIWPSSWPTLIRSASVLKPRPYKHGPYTPNRNPQNADP